MAVVYLIRHGQASSTGPTYDKLGPLGHTQSTLLGQALHARGVRPTAVYTGTLLRHRETASTCLASLGTTDTPEALAGFNEYDHEAIVSQYRPQVGAALSVAVDFGKNLSPRRAFAQIFEHAMTRWVSGAHDTDYPESWSHFSARCNAAFDAVASRTGRKQTSFVFTSGGVVTAICKRVLELDDIQAMKLHYRLVNSGVTKLVLSERGPFLSTLNEHAHLEGRHADLITYR